MDYGVTEMSDLLEEAISIPPNDERRIEFREHCIKVLDSLLETESECAARERG
jgi:hypothetical protein